MPHIILYTFAAAIAVTLFIASVRYPDQESQNKLKELQLMAAKMPLLPSFQERRRSENSKHGLATIIITYYSPASYEEVKDFYSKTVSAKGFGPPVEESRTPLFGSDQVKKTLVFGGGEFQIRISEEDSSEFSFIYHWDSKM